MKACFFRRYGGPEVLEYGDLPDPVPAAGESLVDIHAASVNAADWKMRAGQYGAATEFPHVPGRDFSGVVPLATARRLQARRRRIRRVRSAARGRLRRENRHPGGHRRAQARASLTHAQCAAIALAGLTARSRSKTR